MRPDSSLPVSKKGLFDSLIGSVVIGEGKCFKIKEGRFQVDIKRKVLQ